MDTIKKILCMMMIIPLSYTGFGKIIKVKILNSRFDPAAISICEGDTILWNNISGSAMEIVSGSHCKYDGVLNSGSIVNGTEYSFVFTKTGNYTYYTPALCSEGMKGLVLVNPKKAEINKAKNLEPTPQKKSSYWDIENSQLSKPNMKNWYSNVMAVTALKPKEIIG